MINLDDINIEETRAQIACMLNELWHSRLPNLHWSNVVRSGNYVCYVFKYKQALIGVAIWSSPVAANRMKDGRLLLELRRLALSDVCPKNMASFVSKYKFFIWVLINVSSTNSPSVLSSVETATAVEAVPIAT